MPPIATESTRRSELTQCANSDRVRRSINTLLDHLVGAGEQLLVYGERHN
jgi:hypothetical protein